MTKLTTGVYCIENKIDGKAYIGSAAKSLGRRMTGHRYYLNKGQHNNQHLQRAWLKYGKTNFVFSILELCLPEVCTEREQYWIDFYQSFDRELGYNKAPIAGSPLGVKHTKKTRGKLSIASKGKPKSPEHKENIRKAKLNMSDVTKQKMSVYARNRPKSQRDKLAKAMLGNKNGCHPCSDAKKELLREISKERWRVWKQSGRSIEIGKRISKAKRKTVGGNHA